MDKSEIQAMIKEYIKDNLTIRIKTEEDSDCSGGTVDMINVELYLEHELIDSDYLIYKRGE